MWIRALPLDEEKVKVMAAGDVNSKELGWTLDKNFGWSSNEAARIWVIGPEPIGNGVNNESTCVQVDARFGLQITEDSRSNIAAALMQVARQGVLVNAPMRGVCFDLVDANLHSDSVHWRPDSVVPAAS